MLLIFPEAVTQRCPVKKVFFAKFTGKHTCQSLFFNKVACPRPTLLKKRLWHRCFPLNFAKISKNTFSYKTPSVAASEFLKVRLVIWTFGMMMHEIYFKKEIQRRFFFLSGFSFTTIHEPQDCKGRGRVFL